MCLPPAFCLNLSAGLTTWTFVSAKEPRSFTLQATIFQCFWPTNTTSHLREGLPVNLNGPSWQSTGLHWLAPSVDTNLGERGGEEFISNTKLTPFNPLVRYLKGSFDARKHASARFKWFRRQKATNSHHFYQFSHCYKFLEPAIISTSWGFWSLSAWGWDSKNVPIGNLEPEKLHERRKSRLKIAQSLLLTTHQLNV